MQNVTWVRPKVQTDSRDGRTPKVWDLGDYWLSYSDQNNVEGLHRFSITLQGRSFREGGTPLPWDEVFKKGDLAWVEGANWAGGYAPGLSDDAVLADGMIVAMHVSESLSDDSYSNTITLICDTFASILARDAVAYWMYYGGVRGVLRARAQLPLQAQSGRLDKILAEYMDKVVFTNEMWGREGGGIKERVSYAFTSLPFEVPPLDLSIAEGTHWTILGQHLDQPFHELYSVTQAQADRRGERTSNASITRGEANASTTIVMRRAPYPHVTPDGRGDVSDWHALKLHDHTNQNARQYGERTATRGIDDGHYNFWLSLPRFMGITDRAALAKGVAVHNPAARRIFAHAPMRVSTAMLFDVERSDETILDTTRRLTWRLAGQWNRLEDYRIGGTTIPFAPSIQPGERILIRVPYGDNTRKLEAHIDGRSHSVERERGGTTSIDYSRGLFDNLYQDPAYFADGLEEWTIDADDAASITDGTE